MQEKNHLFGGAILVFLGAVFLLRLWIPNLIDFDWPLIILGIGCVFLFAASISHVGAVAIPGIIITGIGGILYYQNLTGNWKSWAYAWTLIPGFVGIGILIANVLTPECRKDYSGWILIFISVISFFLFGSILAFGRHLIIYWPVLLILAGLFIGVDTLLGKISKD